LASLQEHVDEYTALQSVVIGAVGQWPREVRKYADRHDITFPLLTDKDRHVIKSYGVHHRLGIDAYNIARPATFVIDKNRIIQFMYVGSHQFDLANHQSLIDCLKSLSS
jgi:peroxiredoxin